MRVGFSLPKRVKKRSTKHQIYFTCFFLMKRYTSLSVTDFSAISKATSTVSSGPRPKDRRADGREEYTGFGFSKHFVTLFRAIHCIICAQIRAQPITVSAHSHNFICLKIFLLGFPRRIFRGVPALDIISPLCKNISKGSKCDIHAP